eukprot:scaffold213392_cov36-Prasinocladus_malaysianus.AAC.1
MSLTHCSITWKDVHLGVSALISQNWHECSRMVSEAPNVKSSAVIVDQCCHRMFLACMILKDEDIDLACLHHSFVRGSPMTCVAYYLCHIYIELCCPPIFVSCPLGNHPEPSVLQDKADKRAITISMSGVRKYELTTYRERAVVNRPMIVHSISDAVQAMNSSQQ